jgi:hypothetical protein
MKLKRLRLLAGAVGAATLLTAAAAHGNLLYLPDNNALFPGSGLGTVNTVLTLGSPGNSSSEAGAVFADGTGYATSGDAFAGASQAGLPSLGALGIVSTSALRLILNAVEPAGNSITVSTLTLSFYDAVGGTLASYSLAEPVTIASTQTGIGQAGFVFGLDAAQSAAASVAIANSSTAFGNVRIGLSAALGDATGGHDTFFAANAATPIGAIPEPNTFVLMLAGMGAIGFVIRRRMR